jgi:hypothetical protein
MVTSRLDDKISLDTGRKPEQWWEALLLRETFEPNTPIINKSSNTK